MYNLNNIKRRTYIRDCAISCSLIGTVIINLFSPFQKKIIDKETYRYVIESLEQFKIEDIKKLIFSSPNLSEEEKEYLFNQDFLEDILPLINESIIKRMKYQQHFTNLEIDFYDKTDLGDNYMGYYSASNPNILYIKNYDKMEDNKDTISHEFIHLCQDISGYNLIIEACAEIISYEYYPGSKMSVYSTQVRLVKILMEIIGSKLIWDYNFTGDFSKIEKAIKSYLTNEEYYEFLNCLIFDYNDIKSNFEKAKRLDELLGILYKNKNGKDINEDEIISLINNGMIDLTRYYFNQRYINEESSYYTNHVDKEYCTISYQEAMEKGYFKAYYIDFEEISYEEAMVVIDEESSSVRRDINYQNNKVVINHRTDRGFLTHISGYIDDVKYEEANLDELVEKGLISVTYYKVNVKDLNENEYLDLRDVEGIHIYEVYLKSDFTLYDDHIEGYIPKKIYIDPVNMDGLPELKLKN